MSFTAANSIASFRLSAARRTNRPMRPNPLLPTRPKDTPLAEKDLRQLVELAVHGFQGTDSFHDWNVHDFHSADRDHASASLALDEIDRLDAEPRAKKAIESGRRATALIVPEYSVADFELGLTLYDFLQS